MCGIFAVCQQTCSTKERFSLEKAQMLSKIQSHRGPDMSGFYQDEKTGDILCHERLAIMDLGIAQPLAGTYPSNQVIHNGEIYNFKELKSTELSGMPFRTNCDSEVIVFLYEKYRSGKAFNKLDGVFATAVCCDGEFIVARDPIGVKPLYYGVDQDGRYMFSNEMKCIEKECGSKQLAIFPPGHYWTPKEGFVRYYEPEWFDYQLCTREPSLQLLHDTFVEAVHKRLMSDAPIGTLLSGGLDSSLVSSIAAREMKKRGTNIHSFSIGLDENSPDCVAARQVAEHIGTEHYEFFFDIEDGIKNIKNLIWHLESYDITTIRASTPMFFLSQKIHEQGIKVVLSGEGADEIFGGYLYFHNAPSDEEFQKETIDRVTHLHTADCLRADKSTMAHALEVRVPFLDKAFLQAAIMTKPEAKRPKPFQGRDVEKYLLRKAFELDQDPYLPQSILWRQKEQFSDGVGYNWIDTLMAFCASKVSDEQFAKAAEKYPHNTPASKEAFYMRETFHEHFPSDSAAQTVRRWIPKWQNNQDPSGRASTVHDSTVEKDSPTKENPILSRKSQESSYPQA
ncbi:unnamed protein product [Auanema sp. JU1783]|nr:unnamed protein product [Auanema sp. JU1783]